MVNEITAGDAVHPLAQAGVELPKPKEPIVADPEGIKGMDSAQQPTLCCGACVCRSACLTLSSPADSGFLVVTSFELSCRDVRRKPDF